MRSLVLLLAPLAMAATMGSNKVDAGDVDDDDEQGHWLSQLGVCEEDCDLKWWRMMTDDLKI